MAINLFQEAKGSRGRARLWEEIANHLNAISEPAPRFSVGVRSVRDRINLVLIKKYKKKMADEVKASGIAVEPLSEFDRTIEEICDKVDASENDQSDLEQQKKDKTASDRKIAQEMRIKAMQIMTKTKKRVNADDELENNEKPLQKRGRRSGSDTMLYLKEKSDKDFKLKQEELELRKQEQLVQAKQHTEFTQHLVRQQEKQQFRHAGSLPTTAATADAAVQSDAIEPAEPATTAEPGTVGCTAKICCRKVNRLN